MFKAFLFDLDGTLVDSEVLWVAATSKALETWGVEINREEAEALVYGRAWPEIYADIIRLFPAVEVSIEKLSAISVTAFNELAAKEDIQIHASIDLLKRLARDYPVTVVSGSSRHFIEQRLRHIGVLEMVEFFLGCEDYHPGKPHPACFLLAAEKLGIPPESCLVFEDSAAGVAAAKAAGMGCVALSRPNRPKQDIAAADWIVESLGEFNG